MPIDPALAVDGIDEFLHHFLDPPADGIDDGASFHLHATDHAGEWWLQAAGQRWDIEAVHRKGDVAMRGTASQLLLALWRRVGLDGVDVVGDGAAARRLLAVSALE